MINPTIKPYHDKIAEHMTHVTETRLRQFLTCLLHNMRTSDVQLYDIRELKKRLTERQWAYLQRMYLKDKPNATVRDAMDKIAAWQTGDKIFMDLKQAITPATRDFVHEFTHFLRKSAQQPLELQAHEEMHAFVAEHLVLRLKVPEQSIKAFTKMIWEKVNHPTYSQLKKQSFKQVLNHMWTLIQKPDRLLGDTCGSAGQRKRAALASQAGYMTPDDQTDESAQSGDEAEEDERGIAGRGKARDAACGSCCQVLDCSDPAAAEACEAKA